MGYVIFAAIVTEVGVSMSHSTLQDFKFLYILNRKCTTFLLKIFYDRNATVIIMCSR